MKSSKTFAVAFPLAAVLCAASVSRADSAPAASTDSDAGTPSPKPQPGAPMESNPAAVKEENSKPEVRRPDESKATSLMEDMEKPGWAAFKDLGVPIRFDGYFWNDTGYLWRKNNGPSEFDQQDAYMQGRFVLGASYGRQVGSFAALARVEILGLVNELTQSLPEVHTLDAYLKFGQSWWDFQIGRFLAWEVYYRGQGIELYTAEEAGARDGPALYLLDFTRGLIDEPGQAALHFFPTKWLSFEVAGEYGQHTNDNYYGVRPVADIKYAGFELIGGAELLRQIPQQPATDHALIFSRGYAAQLRYQLPWIAFGIDASRAEIINEAANQQIDTKASLTKASIGGYVDIDIQRQHSIGLGYHYTTAPDRRGEDNTQTQAFISYLYRLPIEGLSAKAVYGFARAHAEDVSGNKQWENYQNSIRIRLLYEFH